VLVSRFERLKTQRKTAWMKLQAAPKCREREACEVRDGKRVRPDVRKETTLGPRAPKKEEGTNECRSTQHDYNRAWLPPRTLERSFSHSDSGVYRKSPQ
jgi:hypothetical protein